MKIIKVEFKKNGLPEYYQVKDIAVKHGDHVIVEADKGVQFATAISNIFEMDNEKFSVSLKSVIRIATKKDIKQHNQNLNDAKYALEKARKLAAKEELNMKILEAKYTFDRDQLYFYFLSENRVDFRNLAKELASIYHTRIELRQVGVRDKAKEVGGIGMCGRGLCCSTFLKEFETVSINMAKNQNLSLNPTKINGLCGRLLCCLNYENECYKECRKGMPKVGQTITTEQGTGVVKEIQILKQTYKVEIPTKGIIEVPIK